MSELRDVILMVATGVKKVGKSYTTWFYTILPYFKGIFNGGKPRKVLIFDVNDEYGVMKPNPTDKEAMRLTGGKAFNVLAMDVRDVRKFSQQTKAEIRRIRPIHTFDVLDKKGNVIYRKGSVMIPSEKVKTLLKILDTYRNGLLLIEDLTKSFGDNIPQDLMGTITSNRHLNLDIVMHLQSVSPMLPRFWQNCEMTRFHKQIDNIDKSEKKLPNYEMYKIAELMVNKQYYAGNKRFYVWIHNLENKLIGNYSKEQLMAAIYQYIAQKPSEIRHLVNETGKDGKKLYTYNQSVEMQSKKLFEIYYGN